jgi:hypothetical protein
MKIVIHRLLLVVAASAWVATAIAEDNLVSLGYGGISASLNNRSSIDASAFGLQFEHKLSDQISITGGLSHLSYTYKMPSTYNASTGALLNSYSETGNGNGLFVDVNYYPNKNFFEGLYVGTGAGVTALSNNWSQNINGSIYTGSSNTNLYDLHGKLGWKIKTGPVVIDPNVRLGYFINSPTGGTKSPGQYLLLGVNVGMPF